MATTYNITAIRGDTKTFNIDVPDINISAYTFRLTIKNIDDNSTDDTTALLAVSWNTHLNNFETSITLTATQTAFATGTYKYDVQMSNAGGTVYTLIIGEWEHVNDVTKTITV